MDFTRDIEPILSARCYGCHGSKVHLGELRLDRKGDALRGGGSGVAAIIPGKSAESLLIRYVSGLDAKTVMPPSGPRLTPVQIQLLRDWIDQGAHWPEHEEVSGSGEKKQIDHWAFMPGRKVSPPVVKDRAWVRNPIDAFVLARLEERGWKPSPPPAEPMHLLRRMHLDLVDYLPPSPSRMLSAAVRTRNARRRDRRSALA